MSARPQHSKQTRRRKAKRRKDPDSAFADVQELAAALRIERNLCYRMIAAGRVEGAFRTSSRGSWRIPRATILAMARTPADPVPVESIHAELATVIAERDQLRAALTAVLIATTGGAGEKELAAVLERTAAA
jgi:hypothetical protein